MKLNNVVPPLALGLFISATLAAQDVPPPPSKAAAAQEKKAGNPITDAWITMKVHSQFVPEDALEDSNIDVDTTNGVVTLSGTVATEAGRSRAIAIAKATDGVKSVNDKLKVVPPTDKAAGATGAAKAGGRRVTDGWIKSKTRSRTATSILTFGPARLLWPVRCPPRRDAPAPWQSLKRRTA
jgi:hyperosmotically inducible protein